VNIVEKRPLLGITAVFPCVQPTANSDRICSMLPFMKMVLKFKKLYVPDASVRWSRANNGILNKKAVKPHFYFNEEFSSAIDPVIPMEFEKIAEPTTKRFAPD
jgi:hypothetical protein